MTTERSTGGRAPEAATGGILCIHPGALGDVLQSVPALAALRALAGGTRVAIAAQSRIGRLLVGGGVTDTALDFDGLGLAPLFADGPIPDEVAARLARFDRVVSWFGARAEPYPSRLRAVSPKAVVAAPVPDEAIPVWTHLLGTLSSLGVRPPDPLPVLAVPAAWQADADRALADLGVPPGRPPLLVHPGAGGAAKRWPVEKMAAVVRRLADRPAGLPGGRVVIHQGPADAEAAAALAEALAAGPRPVPAALLVDPPLETLAATFRAAAAYVGSDSGVSHLAAAVGALAVIVFAPGTRERWAPWGPRAAGIDATAGTGDVDAAAAKLTPLLGDTPNVA